MQRVLEIFEALSQVNEDNYLEKLEFMENALVELQTLGESFDPKLHTPEELALLSTKAKATYSYLDQLQNKIFNQL